MMRKCIYFKDIEVINAIENCDNVSELVELSIRYYLGLETKQHIEDYKSLQKLSHMIKKR